MNKPCVVIDTNLVLSALLFSKGRLSVLRQMWQKGCFCPIVSKETTIELVKVLAYPKFQLSFLEQKELLSDYLPWCTTVTMPNLLPAVPNCRDPSDRPFLQLAICGNADYLVTGDKDILCLANQFSLPIVDATHFLKLFNKSQVEYEL